MSKKVTVQMLSKCQYRKTGPRVDELVRKLNNVANLRGFIKLRTSNFELRKTLGKSSAYCQKLLDCIPNIVYVPLLLFIPIILAKIYRKKISIFLVFMKLLAPNI
jgi:hypothetical protein